MFGGFIYEFRKPGCGSEIECSCCVREVIGSMLEYVKMIFVHF